MGLRVDPGLGADLGLRADLGLAADLVRYNLMETRLRPTTPPACGCGPGKKKNASHSTKCLMLSVIDDPGGV